MVASVTAYPFNGVPTTEDQYAALMALIQRPGVVGVPGDTALKVTANGSGMSVQVADGTALINGYRLTVSGGPATVAIAAAGATARVDKIVARVNLSSNTATLVAVKTGDAIPAGSQDLWLADVAVGANVVTITAANVTDQRQHLGAMWHMWATRPAGVNALGYNVTTGVWEYTADLGVTWKPLTLQVIVADSPPVSVTNGALLLVRQGA